jgi:hypothetical protein
VIGSKIQRCHNDLLWLIATLHRNRGVGSVAEGFHVPDHEDIGQEWTRPVAVGW